MSWILWNSLSRSSLLLTIFSAILTIDIIVWFSTKQLVKKEKHFTGFVESLLQALGSWYSLGAMAIFTVAWASYDITNNKPSDILDIIISIWTMVLDVLVIIGANYTRVKDRKALQEIYKAIKELDK